LLGLAPIELLLTSFTAGYGNGHHDSNLAVGNISQAEGEEGWSSCVSG